jgi:hypothetical protein
MFWIDEIDFTEIDNCVTWLDFSDRSMLTFRTGTTFVAGIKDKSRYQNNFSQATLANQPNWIGSYKGRTAALFSGAQWLDSSLNTTAIGIANSDYEIYASFVTTNNNTTAQAVITNTTTNERYELQAGLGGGGNGLRFAPDGTVRSDNLNPVSNAAPHVICGRIQSNVSYAIVDGNQNAPTAGGRTTGSLLLRVGARQGGTRALSGAISQIVIYNRPLTVLERASVLSMLGRY